MAVTRDELRELVDALPENRLAAARQALQNVAEFDTASHSEAREAFHTLLFEEGAIVSVPKTRDAARFDKYRPVASKGDRVSETLLEDRR